jgi:hypothetical protein
MDHSKRAFVQIAGIAFLIGTVAFFAGFFGGPLISPNSNLSPLLGFFIAPIGACVGALVGIVRSARMPDAGDLRCEIRWLGLIWSLALLVYLWCANLSGSMLLPGILLQIATVIVGYLLLVIGKSNRQVGAAAMKRRELLLAVLAIVTALAIIPPVDAGHAMPGTAPRFAGFWDSGFDTSKHIPLYVVDVQQLVLEWTAVVAIAVIVLAAGMLWSQAEGDK